jgi:N-methylhydantoinase A
MGRRRTRQRPWSGCGSDSMTATPTMPEPVYLGVDVGGTFTDIVAQSPGKPLRLLKVPTASDPSIAIVTGVQALLRDGEGVARLTYGTTIVTNAMLEGRGAAVALVTTRGFRDVLEIGRQQRDHLYRLDLPGRERPAVPRALRFEVTERMDHRGRVLVPLDESEISGLIDALRGAGVEAVAVSLLHAYANPEHERRIAALLRPHIASICLSSDVNPEFREYERTHTACVNAQLMPLMDRYLQELTAGLRRAGLAAQLRLMQSSGGMTTPGQVRRTPLSMLMSGPAGGVAAACALGIRAGVPDAVTLDMGGTSTDVCLIRGGGAETVSERRIAGQPVRLRSVAVESIGAGGGSVAWVDRAGTLRVGPRSAGASPGPACYGRGGEEPTVTDAYVLLGYVDDQGQVGGLRLDAGLARCAIEPLAQRFRLSVHEAAAGIVEIANAAMVRAIRVVSVQRGFDPRRLALIAYGGAGPVHAGRLAQLMDIPRVLIPGCSSVFSAYGCLIADLRYDAARTVRFPLASTPSATWEASFGEMERDLVTRLAGEGVSSDGVVLRRSMDLRYIGQNYEIEIPVAAGLDAGAIHRRFSDTHRRLYEYATDEPVENITLRVSAVHPTPAWEAAEDVQGAGAADESRVRQIFFYGEGWQRVPAYSRDGLRAGTTIRGPAIIEDAWSTVIVYPRQIIRKATEGLLWIETA